MSSPFTAFRQQFILTKGCDSRAETTQLMAGICGGLDRLELQKIKQRTRRGLREPHLGGFSAGSKTFGYSKRRADALGRERGTSAYELRRLVGELRVETSDDAIELWSTQTAEQALMRAAGGSQ